MNYSTLTATELGFNAFRDYVITSEPCYNSPHGWDRIRAVW
jgi:hypothetical protein